MLRMLSELSEPLKIFANNYATRKMKSLYNPLHSPKKLNMTGIANQFVYPSNDRQDLKIRLQLKPFNSLSKTYSKGQILLRK